MKKNLIIAVLMTLVTTVLFGLLFPCWLRDWRRCCFTIRRMENSSPVTEL